MLKKSFKTEFRKAITNKMAVIDLLIVLALSIYHVITVIINYQDFYELYISKANNENLMITSESLFNRWLALDVASFPTSTFYFMLPLIVVLPYGWSLVSEIRSGYTKNIIVRKFCNTRIVPTVIKNGIDISVWYNRTGVYVG